MTTASSYQSDLRHCSACREYVPYLLSPRAAYCAHCGGRVQLFSPKDMSAFRESVAHSREGFERDPTWSDVGAWRRSAF
jgi:rRNA maturation protein Nop10